MNKRSKSKKLTAVKDHMLICDQPVSFDDFKVLASSNSEFHLKIKESLLISRDQPVLNKNEASLPLHLISYTNILQSSDYLVLRFIHCYLLFVAFSDKIYAPVSFKIILKKFVDKNFVKREYSLKMCTAKNVVHETRRQIHKNMDLPT